MGSLPERIVDPSWQIESLVCMDYLHGYVIDREFEAACFYEYARESVILRDAAAERDALIQRGRRNTARPKSTSWILRHVYEQAAQTIFDRHDCGEWFIQYPWGLIWRCPSFPGKPWNEISGKERDGISQSFPILEVQPLHITKTRILDSLGIFEKFKALGLKRRRHGTKGKLEKVFPILHNKQWTHALFTLDFTETKKRMLERFKEWLGLPENKKRFAKFSHDPTGKTGEPKDHLKALAVWRLHKKLGFEGTLQFTQANRKKDANGNPLPYHDARKGQGKKLILNEAPLCSEESYCYKAKDRAEKYLAEIIPWEFGKFATLPNNKFVAKFERLMKNQTKISKKTS